MAVAAMAEALDRHRRFGVVSRIEMRSGRARLLKESRCDRSRRRHHRTAGDSDAGQAMLEGAYDSSRSHSSDKLIASGASRKRGEVQRRRES